MTRAIADNIFRPDKLFWDFVYPTALAGLGVAAAMAIYLQISGV